MKSIYDDNIGEWDMIETEEDLVWMKEYCGLIYDGPFEEIVGEWFKIYRWHVFFADANELDAIRKIPPDQIIETDHPEPPVGASI